jgi:nicotinamidase-related amidase
MTTDARADAELFEQRGFGGHIGFGERPAIVVIDYMNAFSDINMPLGSDLDAEIEATAALLEAARATGVPVYFTIQAYEEPGTADAGVWKLKLRGLTSLQYGTRAVEIDERLGRRPDEAVILKKGASAFFGTDFVARLTGRGVDTVILSGCTTSGCVRASAVDAVQYGFRPSVVRETVGDRSAAAHEQALFDMEQKYADVISLDEAVGYLRTRG